jgi:O-antigen/teichoic acid export membrane protein
MWKRLSTNIGWSLISLGIVAISGIFVMYFNTRSLGVEGLGAYVTVLAIALMIETLAGMQSWQAMIALTVNERDLSEKFGAALAVNFVLAILGTLIGFVIAFAIELEGAWAAYFHLGTLLFRLPDPALGVLRWHNMFRFIAVIRSAIAITTVLVMIILWSREAALETYLVSSAILYVLSAVALNVQAIRTCFPTYPSHSSVRQVMRFSAAAGGSGAIGAIKARGVVLILDAYAGAAAVGFYAVADRIVSIMQMAYRAAFEVVFREFTRLIDKKGMMSGITLSSLLLSVVAYLLNDFFGATVISLVAGDSFGDSLDILVWLIIVSAVNLTTLGLRAWAIHRLGPQSMLKANFAALFSLFAAPFLIIRFGGVGAALVLLTFEAIWLVVTISMVLRYSTKR